jgi:hypothetical protein
MVLFDFSVHQSDVLPFKEKEKFCMISLKSNIGEAIGNMLFDEVMIKCSQLIKLSMVLNDLFICLMRSFVCSQIKYW